MSDKYLVVLAGGSGTRFWPKSLHKRPKQLCSIDGSGLSMIQKTFDRVSEITPVDQRIVVTHVAQLDATKKNLGERCHTYLAEPEARNTANALALAAIEIFLKDPNGIMVSLHADHIILNEEQFRSDIETACQIARTGQLTLIGVKPTKPETGYGYIQAGADLPDFSGEGFRVKSFKEKPEVNTAQKYLDDGSYFWNTGLFVWKAEVILSELRKHLPEAMSIWDQELLQKKRPWSDLNSKEQAELYARLPKIAIDNAVLEKSDRVSVIKSEFGWYDVGSWNSLADCFGTNDDNNYISGDVLALESSGCVIDSDGPLIATLGIKDLVVVSSGNRIMVCPKDRAQEVKKMVEALRSQGRDELI